MKGVTTEVQNESALKHLFNQKVLKKIAESLHGLYPAFDRKHFLGLMPRLEKLEMKPRVYLLRDELRRQLPTDYKKALAILRKSSATGKFEGFDLWPYSEFVQTFGLEDSKISLEALREFTKVFTSEWAVRPYLKQNPRKTLRFLENCARDADENLRRWASEGTRPRLPWGERLQDFVKDPKPTFKILNLLKFDPSLYVRKSVANHLNDITKDHPDYVVKVLKGWLNEAGEKELVKVEWIIRHSLRSLIKQGYAPALQLIGVSNPVRIKLADFLVVQKRVKEGDKVEFGFVIHSRSSRPQKIVVDYRMHFIRSNGKASPKVFKLKTTTLPPRGKLIFSKSHSLKPISTRKYYAGLHVLEIQVNGVIFGKLEWNLV